MMRLGTLADTHDELARTRRAVSLLRDAGSEALIHCGDLASAPIVEACAELPLWFALGNHDADSALELRTSAARLGAICVGWGGIVDLAGKRIAVAHGHLTSDVRRVLAQQPDLLLTGHAHSPSDAIINGVRRINPGALHRADEFTVALLELGPGGLRFLRVPEW